jgi:hypothetical protein
MLIGSKGTRQSKEGLYGTTCLSDTRIMSTHFHSIAPSLLSQGQFHEIHYPWRFISPALASLVRLHRGIG